MNKTSLAVAAIAVTGVSSRPDGRPRANRTTTSWARCISRHRASRKRRSCSTAAMLYQHSFWYRASQKTFEDVLKADPECAIAYWGIALSLLWNPHSHAGGAEPRRGFRRAGKSARRRRQDRARARLPRRRWAPCTPTTTRSITAPRLLAYAKAMEAAGRALSERRRSADPLCAGAQHLGVAGRQDLRQPAQGRGHPGADRQAPAASIPAWRIT
mgnify:CR=1 FL=1